LVSNVKHFFKGAAGNDRSPPSPPIPIVFGLVRLLPACLFYVRPKIDRAKSDLKPLTFFPKGKPYPASPDF